jgi:hypothetical protein
MSRAFAFFGALLLAFISVSSACTASPADRIAFTLAAQQGDGDTIHASFRSEARGRGENNWEAGFRPSELAGLDLAGFRGSDNRPLRFALIREAGRLDCAGEGAHARASGDCTFTADPGFTRLLESRGIGRPTREQAFGLMAINARREVIDAVAAAHYPTPTIDDLMALAALGVDGRYIGDLARMGYRPEKIQTLVEFKALGITPEWIGGFARAGYGNLPANDLVQIRALGITPDYISGFDRIGYGRLPVNELVQLKALDVTPEFAVAANRQSDRRYSVDQLVQMKALGLGPRMH